MPGLYTRLTAYMPAPASLPLVSRITRLQELLSQARDFGNDELAVPPASSSFHPADTGALELRAMERGLGPISFISSRFAVGLVVMAIACVLLLAPTRPSATTPPPLTPSGAPHLRSLSVSTGCRTSSDRRLHRLSSSVSRGRDSVRLGGPPVPALTRPAAGGGRCAVSANNRSRSASRR